MAWNKADAAEWERTWQEPHMQKGLQLILKRTRPKNKSMSVTPGFDLTPIFIKSCGHYEGVQEVLDLIEELATDKLIPKDNPKLPEPMSHIKPEK